MFPRNGLRLIKTDYSWECGYLKYKKELSKIFSRQIVLTTRNHAGSYAFRHIFRLLAESEICTIVDLENIREFFVEISKSDLSMKLDKNHSTKNSAFVN